MQKLIPKKHKPLVPKSIKFPAEDLKVAEEFSIDVQELCRQSLREVILELQTTYLEKRKKRKA